MQGLRLDVAFTRSGGDNFSLGYHYFHKICLINYVREGMAVYQTGLQPRKHEGIRDEIGFMCVHKLFSFIIRHSITLGCG